MRIDHVTIAGSQLRRMAEALRAFGLESWYGGTHSNGVTEMSLIGFQDSSYLELISVVPGRGPSPWWNPHIQQNAGLAGWAVVVDDIPSVLGAVASRGVTVRGPRAMHRVRPDGRRAEWNLALLGDGEPGVVLPFLIQDQTPRSERVPAEATQTPRPGGVCGIAGVVLAVKSCHPWTELFPCLWKGAEPRFHDATLPAARLVSFVGCPAILYEPRTPDSWLAQRRQQFGDVPAAVLLKTRSLATAISDFGLQEPERFANHWVAWNDDEGEIPLRIGFVAVGDDGPLPRSEP